MPQTFKRKTQIDDFFGEKILKGRVFEPKNHGGEKRSPHIYYDHPHGKLFLGDTLSVMRTFGNASVDLIFADPPYSIKKADWDCFDSHDEYIAWSIDWIREASRILKNEGSLFVCGFSEILADIKANAAKYYHSCRWIVWHYKNKASLGNDWGRSHESILHLRKSKDFCFDVENVRIPYSEHTLKYPSHPQALTSQYGNGKNHIWEPNPNGAKPKDVLEIPTTCNGMHEKTPHPTQKPEELLRRIILSSSGQGDLVFDPFLGSGTTAVCAEQLKRKWIGCDISQEYLEWAVNRIELVEDWSIDQWKQYDFENMKRRNSIR